MSKVISRVILAVTLLGGSTLPDSVSAADFVYTNDDLPGGNPVSGFSVATNGALAPVAGSPFATGGFGASGGLGLIAANRLTSCILGGFLYVSNNGSGDVSGFSIDPITGVLTPVPGVRFPVSGDLGPEGAIGLACTSNGRFLMATRGVGLIEVFSIASNGALSPIPGSPFPTAGSPAGIKVSPGDQFLAVAEPFIHAVEMFSIGPTGELVPVPGSPFQTGEFGIAGLDIDCAGRRLFGGEPNIGATIVHVLDIGPTGALTALPGSPFTFEVGSNSNVVLLSPDDETLFASNQASSSVTAFSVGTGGSLALTPGSPFSAPGSVDPAGMATSRAGSLLYVADLSNSVYVYNIGSGGVLALVPGSPFPTGQPGGLLSLTAFPAKACVLEVGPPINKEECKHNGWRTFTIPRAFKNQGDCIQFVNTGK